MEPMNILYPVVIHPDVYPDGSMCWVAKHPDLPGCMAHADTVKEAEDLLAEARAVYLEYLDSKDRGPPLPRAYRQRNWLIGDVLVGGAAASEPGGFNWEVEDTTEAYRCA
jgi:predicted RNase H-like HicB family nuclease